MENAFRGAGCIVACLGLGLLGAGLLSAWIDRRMRKAVGQAAEALGLPAAPSTDGQKDGLTFGGTLDGGAVTLGSRWKTVRPIASRYAGPVGRVTIVATLPRPLAFPLSIRQRPSWPPKSVTTGDRAFDRACLVETTEERSARHLLEDEAL